MWWWKYNTPNFYFCCFCCIPHRNTQNDGTGLSNNNLSYSFSPLIVLVWWWAYTYITSMAILEWCSLQAYPFAWSDVAVYVHCQAWWRCCSLCPWHKPTEVATPFCYVLVSVSVFVVLSTIHSINPPNSLWLSCFVIPTLLMSCWPFWTIYLFMKVYLALI